jgi:poly-gamma-glutamate synthesis protein (capsule biosynthesis protein)
MRSAVTLALAGDVMLGRGVARSIRELGPIYPWGNILPSMRRADCFLINLECALTSRTKHWHENGKKAFSFRAHPRAIKTLQSARVDLAALANNHAVDFGPAGLLDTVRCLDDAGIAHAGAGADLAAAAAPAFLTVRDWRIGVVAFADYPESWAARSDTPGINYAPVSLAAGSFGAIERTLDLAHRQADLIIFSMYLGAEYAAPADCRAPRFRPPRGRSRSRCVLGSQHPYRAGR